jgi:hypothetical protein
MDERTLVGRGHVGRANAELRAVPRGAILPALEHEPVLHQVISDHMEHLAGKMTMAGLPSPLVRRVMRDVDRLVALTITALRSAYGDVLAGLLPDDIRDTNPGEQGSADDKRPAR